jgi:hypothetical protein
MFVVLAVELIEAIDEKSKAMTQKGPLPSQRLKGVLHVRVTCFEIKSASRNAALSRHLIILMAN